MHKITRALSILLPLALTACGFEPMAAVDTRTETNQVLVSQLANVRIETQTLSEQRLLGQQFRTTLEDLTNPGGSSSSPKDYVLKVNLTPTATPGFIAPDGTAQRFLVNLRSGFQLIDLRNNKLIGSGALHRNSSYSNLPNSFFSTHVAEQDTLKRLAVELAEQYRIKLVSLLATPSQKLADDKIDSRPTGVIQPKSAVSVPGLNR